MPKHDRDQSGNEQETAAKRPKLDPQHAASSDGYGLIHTLGRTQYDELGGDGAYSKWMQEYFKNSSTHDGCRAVAQIKYPGPFGNVSNADIPGEFNPVFITLFKAQIESPPFQNISRIILNWHVRFAKGTPNGWTGRGINQSLVEKMDALCAGYGKKLGIVYTVHEDSDLDKKLLNPSGVVSLNPAVGESMAKQFPNDNLLVSKVPGLMQSTHTVKIDTLLQLVGQYDKSVDLCSAASNLFWAHGQQLLRLTYAPKVLTSEGQNGVVIFGMIMPRHGLNRDVVSKLARQMDTAGLDPSLKIVIAGKESNKTLADQLRQLSLEVNRVSVSGKINGLDELAGCRYAISFDPGGYRDNASAMVNVVREGHVLFSRQSGETDDTLIARAVRGMGACEKSEAMYYDALAANQPRLREASPNIVGADLNIFFANVARNL